MFFESLVNEMKYRDSISRGFPFDGMELSNMTENMAEYHDYVRSAGFENKKLG